MAGSWQTVVRGCGTRYKLLSQKGSWFVVVTELDGSRLHNGYATIWSSWD